MLAQTPVTDQISVAEQLSVTEQEVSAPLELSRLGYIQQVAWGSPSTYQEAKTHPLFSDLNWSDDGCSAPTTVLKPVNELFRPACEVHDFGYRNLARITPVRDWEGVKNRIDETFLNSMLDICEAGAAAGRFDCRDAAQVYYLSVRDLAWPVWIYYSAQAAFR